MSSSPSSIVDRLRAGHAACDRGAHAEAASIASALLEDDLEDADRGRAFQLAALAAHAAGDAAGAKGAADEAIGFFRVAAPDDPAHAAALHLRAHADLETGDLPAGLERLAAASAILEGVVEAALDHATVLLTMAEVSGALGEFEAAEALAGQALERLDAVEPDSPAHAAHLNAVQGQALLALGGARVRSGGAGATDALARAVELFEAAFDPGSPERMASLAEVAAVLRAGGYDDEAARVEQDAETLDVVITDLEAAAALLEDEGD